MRCDRFSFLIALQREEPASSLQPRRPPPTHLLPSLSGGLCNISAQFKTLAEKHLNLGRFFF